MNTNTCIHIDLNIFELCIFINRHDKNIHFLEDLKAYHLFKNII